MNRYFFVACCLYLLNFTANSSEIVSESYKHKSLWKLSKPAYLNGIAEMSYGHRAYTRVIAKYNNLSEHNRIPKDTSIKTPHISQMLKNLGLYNKYDKPFQIIISTVVKFRTTSRNNFELAQKKDKTDYLSPAAKKAYIGLSEELSKAAKLIQSISQKEGNTPKHLISRIKDAASTLKTLATGNSPMASKDEDMVEQYLARVFANAVVWSRE